MLPSLRLAQIFILGLGLQLLPFAHGENEHPNPNKPKGKSRVEASSQQGQAQQVNHIVCVCTPRNDCNALSRFSLNGKITTTLKGDRRLENGHPPDPGTYDIGRGELNLTLTSRSQGFLGKWFGMKSSKSVKIEIPSGQRIVKPDYYTRGIHYLDELHMPIRFVLEGKTYSGTLQIVAGTSSTLDIADQHGNKSIWHSKCDYNGASNIEANSRSIV